MYVTDCLENVGASTSHNSIGFQGLRTFFLIISVLENNFKYKLHSISAINILFQIFQLHKQCVESNLVHLLRLWYDDVNNIRVSVVAGKRQ
jgi:hypothetical protein